MGRRIILLSTCAGFLAVVLLGWYPSEEGSAFAVTKRLGNAAGHMGFVLHSSDRIRNSSEIKGSWDILYHMGGNGPWIPNVHGIEGGIEPPAKCRVDQVHMVGLRK